MPKQVPFHWSEATLLLILLGVAAACFSFSGHLEARSERSREMAEFRRVHPCPSTSALSGPCKGYVIDNVRPRRNGGANDTDKLQWRPIP